MGSVVEKGAELLFLEDKDIVKAKKEPVSPLELDLAVVLHSSNLCKLQRYRSLLGHSPSPIRSTLINLHIISIS